MRRLSFPDPQTEVLFGDVIPFHKKYKLDVWLPYVAIATVAAATIGILIWLVWFLIHHSYTVETHTIYVESAFTQEVEDVVPEDDGEDIVIEDSILGRLTIQKHYKLGRNPLRTLGIKRGEGGIVIPENDGRYTIEQGIDVSEWQGDIDWKKVRADDIDFAIIRCGFRGYRDGVVYTDSDFYKNIREAKAAGLSVGVYFYSQALGRDEGLEEAQYVLKILNGMPLDLPVFFDWEQAPESPARTDNLPSTNLNNAAKMFLQTIRDGGYQAGLYSYKYLAYSEYELEDFAEYPFWLAEYDTRDFYYGYTFLQYTSKGRVNGIYGNVDRNLFIAPVKSEN